MISFMVKDTNSILRERRNCSKNSFEFYYPKIEITSSINSSFYIERNNCDRDRGLPAIRCKSFRSLNANRTPRINLPRMENNSPNGNKM